MSTLPSIENDFPAWYGEVVKAADLAENSLVRGTMVIKPYGTRSGSVQREVDDRIKATGHENFDFPTARSRRLLAGRPTWSRGSRRRSRW